MTELIDGRPCQPCAVPTALVFTVEVVFRALPVTLCRRSPGGGGGPRRKSASHVRTINIYTHTYIYIYEKLGYRCVCVLKIFTSLNMGNIAWSLSCCSTQLTDNTGYLASSSRIPSIKQQLRQEKEQERERKDKLPTMPREAAELAGGGGVNFLLWPAFEEFAFKTLYIIFACLLHPMYGQRKSVSDVKAQPPKLEFNV